MYSLQGKHALVTGSSDGIGYDIALVLAQQGCNVILSGSRPVERVDQALLELRTTYPDQSFHYIQVDLSEPQNTKVLFTEALRLSKDNITILVNNAGVQHVSPIHKFEDDQWNWLMNVNLNSVFYLMREFIAFWRKNQESTGEIPWGRIINISSVHGLVASVNKAPYIASKHAVNGLTKAASLELADTNITCNAICPGYVKTSLVLKQIERIQKEKGITNEEAKELLVGEKQPTKRFSEGSAVGQYVAFLCSDFASNITGAQQVIDGAWTTQ